MLDRRLIRYLISMFDDISVAEIIVIGCKGIVHLRHDAPQFVFYCCRQLGVMDLEFVE